MQLRLYILYLTQYGFSETCIQVLARLPEVLGQHPVKRRILGHEGGLLVLSGVRDGEDVNGAVAAGGAEQPGVRAGKRMEERRSPKNTYIPTTYVTHLRANLPKVDGVDERGLRPPPEFRDHVAPALPLGAENPDEGALVGGGGKKGAGDVDGNTAQPVRPKTKLQFVPTSGLIFLSLSPCLVRRDD